MAKSLDCFVPRKDRRAQCLACSTVIANLFCDTQCTIS